jgi:hypothetical protein
MAGGSEKKLTASNKSILQTFQLILIVSFV